jgi:hypothetical protein
MPRFPLRLSICHCHRQVLTLASYHVPCGLSRGSLLRASLRVHGQNRAVRCSFPSFFSSRFQAKISESTGQGSRFNSWFLIVGAAVGGKGTYSIVSRDAENRPGARSGSPQRRRGHSQGLRGSNLLYSITVYRTRGVSFFFFLGV